MAHERIEINLEISADRPHLAPEDVRAARAFAADNAEQEESIFQAESTNQVAANNGQ